MKTSPSQRVLLLDNHDSFTFNLVQALRELGAEVVVVTNDRFDPNEVHAIDPTQVVISPGPGRPADAGCTPALIREVKGRIPLLGVCLGHQAIAEHFGGEVRHGERPSHGEAEQVHHERQGLFEGLPAPLQVGRYHSLVVEPRNLPDCLEVTAFTSSGEVMAIRHRDLPIDGIQFHPESVLTPRGPDLLRNFLQPVHTLPSLR